MFIGLRFCHYTDIHGYSTLLFRNQTVPLASGKNNEGGMIMTSEYASFSLHDYVFIFRSTDPRNRVISIALCSIDGASNSV